MDADYDSLISIIHQFVPDFRGVGVANESQAVLDSSIKQGPGES